MACRIGDSSLPMRAAHRSANAGPSGILWGEPGRVNLDGIEYIVEQWAEGPRFINVGPTKTPNMFNPKTTIGRY